MNRRDRFEEDDGAWRQLLPRWSAHEAPAGLERALRQQFRARRRRALVARWGTWAAAVALAASGVLALVRLDDARQRARQEDDGSGDVCVSVVGDQVRAEIDLAGFQPVRRPRLTRLHEAASDTRLEEFVPVRRMKVTRWDGPTGGRR
jgi:hypothetical protein